RVHADPNVIADFHRRGFQFRTRRTIFEKWRERLRVDQSLRRFERMKTGVREPDAPRDETIRTDVDPFFRHDDRAVEQREVADAAFSILADRERTTGVNRNVIAEDDRARFFADQLLEDLRALAVKAVAEFYVGRNRLQIPIVLYMSI